MIKKTITTCLILPALACGPDTIIIYPQTQNELPVTELEYLEANTAPEVEELFYAERIVFEEEQAPEEDATEQPVEEEVEQEEQPVEEEPVQEEQPAEEQPAEEQPAEEEPVEEEPVEEEPVEEEQPAEEEQPVEEEEVPVEEEVVEEEEVPVEEEVVEEEQPTEDGFSDECNLEGNIYNFQSSCIYPLACLSRHVDNFEVIPETGFCGKICFGHSNCPGDTQCVMNGVTPGVGYCER